MNLKGRDKRPCSEISLIVTGNNSWATVRATGIFYVTIDGKWRVQLNIVGTTAAASPITLAVNGVTFANVFRQSLSGDAQQNAAWYYAYVEPATNNIVIGGASTPSGWVIAGDVELQKKPTFME
jgi:hypothetical protein